MKAITSGENWCLLDDDGTVTLKVEGVGVQWGGVRFPVFQDRLLAIARHALAPHLEEIEACLDECLARLEVMLACDPEAEDGVVAARMRRVEAALAAIGADTQEG